ncbi:MAG TPA: glycosyltransferase family 39 protein [Pirellulales bacterium]
MPPRNDSTAQASVSDGWPWLRISLTLTLIAAAYIYRLDRPLLWGDEADTGIIARNVLRVGYPVAYDDRNVTMFENGSQLNRDLVCKKIPWVQYYLGALSIELFGDSTAGLRMMFALVGVAAFFPIYAVLRSRVKCSIFVTALALIAPQTLLFQRNARYYSTLILLDALLIWHLYTPLKSPKLRYASAIVIAVLFFHTHPLAAACSFAALIVYCLIFQRATALVYCISGGVGFLSWFIWQAALGPSLGESNFAISQVTTDFSGWLHGFFVGIAAFVVDVDVVDCLPLLLWAALLVVLWRKNRSEFINFFKQPLPTFVLLNLLLQGLVTAVLFGSESGDDADSLLRYMPHVLLFVSISGFLLLDRVIASKRLFAMACIAVVGCNLFTISYWTKPFTRQVPISWSVPVYADIILPHDNVWDDIIGELRRQADRSAAHDATLLISPPWVHDVALYYLGDRYLVPPIFDPPCQICEAAIARQIGNDAYQHLATKSRWVVDILGAESSIPSDYEVVAQYPVFQRRPDDGTRPELTRHTFNQPESKSNPLGTATIYRLKSQ